MTDKEFIKEALGLLEEIHLEPIKSKTMSTIDSIQMVSANRARAYSLCMQFSPEIGNNSPTSSWEDL